MTTFEVLRESDLEVLGDKDFLGAGLLAGLLLHQGVFGFTVFLGGGDFFFLILVGLVSDLNGRLKRSEEYSPDASGNRVLISLTIQWGRRQLKGD